MKIAICDDEKNVRSYIRSLIEKQGGKYVIREYASGRELISDIKKNNTADFDIVFLDIAMDDTDGITAAENLRTYQSGKGINAWGSLPLIIFVTGYKDYMQKAFSVNAFQYILKPVDETEFEKIFLKAQKEVQKFLSRKDRPETKFYIGNGIDAKAVKSEDVIFIESIGHKNLVCCDKVRMEYYGNLSDLERELSPDFFRIHRGYLINLNRVDHYGKQDVYMDNGDRLPLSRYKYQSFVKAYFAYLRQ